LDQFRSDEMLTQAAAAIKEATALLITAGAGMGVDSGLPDFRGSEGFWNAYPPYRHLGLQFEELANPRWFRDDVELAWGFYGHRLNLYRTIEPHDGFARLLRWGKSKPQGYFVFTSNVDGQFQKAGFPEDRVVECHGSIHHMQCFGRCRAEIFPSQINDVDIDLDSMRARPPFPSCPACERLARPNVLMFGDSQWNIQRTELQHTRLTEWMRTLNQHNGNRLVIIECGAGMAVPRVRAFGESVAQIHDATLIRINPREAEGPPSCVSLSSTAQDALATVDSLIQR
jgi:NAD-dependent SIR2 family protein deacetylase